MNKGQKNDSKNWEETVMLELFSVTYIIKSFRQLMLSNKRETDDLNV